MERYDFSLNNGAIESLFEFSESALSNDAPEIIIMDDALFELPPYDVMMDRSFDQQFGNSLQNKMWAPHYSAFTAYINAHSNTAADSLVSSETETLHKRCFRFLRKIEEDRKLEIQRSRQKLEIQRSRSSAPAQDVNAKRKNHHMIAERNRRVKLNEHFQNLYSLLPRNCKKNKDSILANTTSYLRELQLRVRDLQQQSESVSESIPRSFTNSGGGSGGFESHDKPFNSENPLLYCSDDVILEQCEDFPGQVKIIINVQRRTVSCPASLLMKVIEMLSAEQLEIISLSHIKGFGFQAIFIVLPKVEKWDISHWQMFGRLVNRTVS